MPPVSGKNGDRRSFTIRHSTGEVTYETANFLFKNKDILRAELVEVVRRSEDKGKTLSQGDHRSLQSGAAGCFPRASQPSRAQALQGSPPTRDNSKSQLRALVEEKQALLGTWGPRV